MLRKNKIKNTGGGGKHVVTLIQYAFQEREHKKYSNKNNNKD